MGLVALTGMPVGSLPATATLSGSYLRPAFLPLRFEAAVTQSGRRLVFVTVEVYDGEDRRCVSFTGTMASQGRD
jgi:acyl-coenzyme A thioesterase PaaI-like protein